MLTLVLNAFVFDEYDAYGEVPIPGSSSLELPAGDVTVTLPHRARRRQRQRAARAAPELTGSRPDGVRRRSSTEDYGGTTTVNNDARVRIGYRPRPDDGAYDVELDGNVSAYLNPARLRQGQRLRDVPWILAAVFGLAVVDLIFARIWAAQVARRRRPAATPARPPPPMSRASAQPATRTCRPTRASALQQLNTLARYVIRGR